jgi:hypothetical protein
MVPAKNSDLYSFFIISIYYKLGTTVAAGELYVRWLLLATSRVKRTCLFNLILPTDRYHSNDRDYEIKEAKQ